MNPWLHTVRTHNPAATKNLETVFTQSNGYLGIRGYEEEGVAGAESDPMQFVAGYFDRSPVTRNTMVNIPTIKRIRLMLNGEPLDTGTGTLRDFQRSLDMSCAVSERSFIWTSPQGRTTRISFVSYLSYTHHHLYLTEISVRPVNWSGPVGIEDVFDGAGLTLDQKHFKITGHGDCGNGHFCGIRTLHSKLDAVLACAYETNLAAGRFVQEESVRDKETVVKRSSARIRRGQMFRLRRYAVVATGFDKEAGKAGSQPRALRYLREAMRRGWAGLRREQKTAWRALWSQANVGIEGDPTREFQLRFSIFQMLQSYRPGDPRLSIGAKFLSGDHYSGHYFWDTDIFLTPFYLLTMPRAAQDLVEYRVRNIAGACLKARSKKFKGAFYPWEACALDGRENCPKWWKDKAAHEPVYIPCGDIELHINSAVAMSATNYLNLGGRPRPARLGIHRLLVEIARFWASRGTWEKGRFSIKNVIGPDEYHEYVDDNAYTNHTARWCLRRALGLVESPKAATRLGVRPKEMAAWKAIVDGIELGHDAAWGILAQDRAFLRLQEFDPSKFQPGVPLFRQLSIHDIGKLQAVKQADVLALFHLLPFEYDLTLMQRCWDYYEPRTVHDSNLSAGSHAVVAALLRRREDFRNYYDKVLTLDIGGGSYNVEEGLHAANAGNAWASTVIGAAGIRWTDDTLCCAPQLLKEWKALSFSLTYRGRKLDFRIDRKAVTIRFGSGRAIRMIVAGRSVQVSSKAQTIRVPLDPLAVVFDLDGVLVDSAVCHYRAWKMIADELGIPFDEKTNDRLRGVSRRESLMVLLEGRPMPDEAQIGDLMHRKNELYKQIVNEAGDTLLLPGVKPFLTRLKLAGVRLAVASSSKNTPALLRQAGLDRHYFDAIADGNDIRKSKPHPEVFLLAARRIGVKPSRCLCVEDAPAGIEAGRRAGMKTLGLGPADTGPCDWRKKSIAAMPPDEIFDMLAELTQGS